MNSSNHWEIPAIRLMVELILMVYFVFHGNIILVHLAGRTLSPAMPETPYKYWGFRSSDSGFIESRTHRTSFASPQAPRSSFASPQHGNEPRLSLRILIGRQMLSGFFFVLLLLESLHPADLGLEAASTLGGPTPSCNIWA